MTKTDRGKCRCEEGEKLLFEYKRKDPLREDVIARSEKKLELLTGELFEYPFGDFVIGINGSIQER